MDAFNQALLERMLATFDRNALRFAEELLAPGGVAAEIDKAYIQFVTQLLFLDRMLVPDKETLAAFDQDFVIVCIRCKLLDRPKEAFYLLGVHFVLMGRQLYAGTWPIILSPLLLTPAQSEKRHSVWLAPPCPCLPRPPPLMA